MTPLEALILGTRGSRLALTQAEACARQLHISGLAVEIRVIKTTSDHHPDTPLSVIDRRDVFTRQLDEALMKGEIDLAVHSLKDVPTELPEGIVIAAFTERHDPSDVLVSEERYGVDELPAGTVVATSSLRRRAQILHRRPDLKIVEIRGNVDTRVRKMRVGEADALVLASAGLERLGMGSQTPHTIIPPEVMLPAVGQGSLAAALDLRDGPLFFVDIAVPRDVDPVVQTLGQVFVYDMDDLQAVVERNADGRGEAARKGEAMITPAVVEFMNWLSSLHVVPLIQELRDGAERIRRHELARALQRMDLSPEEAEAVERMSRSLMNKLLHGPISELKALAETGHPLEGAEIRRQLLALEGLGVALHRHHSDPR